MAARLTEKEANPAAKFAVRAANGITVFLRGRWREAKETLDPIQAMATSRRSGQQTVTLFTLQSMYFMGQIKEVSQRYARLMVEAEERGNLFMSVNLRTAMAGPVWLAADDPAKARRELSEAMADWSQAKFSNQEWRTIMFGGEIDLYVGDGAGAYKRVEGLARTLRKNSFFFVQYVRALTTFVQGRAAIASLETLTTALRPARLAEVRRLQRRLEGERMVWTAPLAAILQACWARAAGDRAGAVAALREAIERAHAADMAIYAAAAQYRLGMLLGGDEGAAIVDEAEDAMSTRGIHAPARFAAMLVPGSSASWGARPELTTSTQPAMP